jgi:hypothetical protein
MPTSPLRTGGAGVDVEREVGAIYLAALLTGAPVRGAHGGAAIQVRFQQAHADAPLDDISIQTQGPDGVVRCDLQLKRSFTFSRSDREFAPVLNACWATARLPEFRAPGARLGVVIENFPPRVKEHYARVPEWARTSTSAEDFFSRISTPRLACAEMRDFVDRVSEHLRDHDPEGATDEALWHFFAHLVILDFDTQLEASRDRHAAITLLRSAVPGGSVEAAEDLYWRLVQAVRASANTGGGFTAETLREHLIAGGAQLTQPQSIGDDARRLAEFGDRTLEEIESTIGGVQVDRGATTDDVLDAMDNGGVVLLVGSGGLGKSAILKTVASVRRQDGFVFALGKKRLAGIVGWEGLAERLQLRASREQIVVGLSGTGRPVLVVDGADRIEEEGARLAVLDVLRAIERVPRGAADLERWGVVVTTRAEALEEVRQWMGLANSPTRVAQVPELANDEVAALATRLPHLGSVLNSQQLGPVVRNPYFLRVLEETRTGDQVFRGLSPVSEAAVLRIWWEQLVGRPGARGRARQQAMLSLGKSALASRRRALATEGVSPEVLHGLESDGILRRDADTDTYWFGHDIIEEWTSARVLAHESADLPGYLRSIGDPFWAFGGLQLFACSILESGSGPERWTTLLAGLEAVPEIELRWPQAILTAPLRSARLAALLPLIGDALLQANGERLKALLRAVRTQAIKPDPRLEPLLARSSLPAEERATMLLEYAWPDPVVWYAVLSWLVPQLRGLPGALREEVSRLMMIWQRATGPGVPFRRGIAEAALDWYSILDHPSGEHVVIQSGAEPYFARLRDIVAASADAIPERIPEFLGRLRRVGRGSNEVPQWIAQSPQLPLIQHTPAAYVDFVLDVLAPGWRDQAGATAADRARRRGRGGRFDDDLDWQHSYTDSAFLHPSHLRGPFLLLLNEHEDEGLRLVHRLVTYATKRWAASHYADREHPPVALRIGDEDRTFLGDAEVYRWFRPMANAPYVVASALMALEVWMETQLEGGRDPGELFQTVLAGATSVAEVAVCVAMALAYPERCKRAAVTFVANPVLWLFDEFRCDLDASGTISFEAMFGREPSEEAARQRDDRPQRKMHLRFLVWRYLFLSEFSDLATRVSEVIRAFPDDLTALTPQERRNPAAVAAFRRRREQLAAWGDPDNYQFYRSPDGTLQPVFQPPERLLDHNPAAVEHFQRMEQYLSLQQWARRTLDTGAPADGLTLAQAVAQARELQRPDDFTRPIVMDGDYEYVRLHAIVGVAAAAVQVDADGASSSGWLEWCREVLVAGALAPEFADAASPAIPRDDVALSSGRGLMLLIRAGLADERCRLVAFGLLRAPSKVADEVMAGVQQAWDADLVFCRNAVAHELSLAVTPHRERVWTAEAMEESEAEERARVEAIAGQFQTNVREGILPEMRFAVLEPTDHLSLGRVLRALRAIPHERLGEGVESDLALAVTDAVLSRFAAKAAAEADQGRSPGSAFRYQTTAGWGNWLAVLTGVLSDAQFAQHVEEPLRASWPATAKLTAEFMYALTREHLATETIADDVRSRWSSIAEWVLPQEPLNSHQDRWMDRDAQEARGLLLHVRHGRPVLTEHWQGAPHFIGIYDRWVSLAAHGPWGLQTFIAFAVAGGSRLPAIRLIEWLHTSVGRAADREPLWREHGNGIAAAELLARIWTRSKREISGDSVTLKRFVSLCDDLVRAGVPLAAQLRGEVG